MMQKIYRISFVFLIGLVTGCNYIAPITDGTSTPDATGLFATSELIATNAFAQTQTIQAYEATGIAVALTAAVTPTPIPTLDRTRPPVTTPTKEPDCNAVSPGVPLDVTIRDGSQMHPGESFTKTWRLMNNGSCKWTRLFALVFFSGNAMEAIQTHYLSGEVPPGSMVDLSVDMVAPNTPGDYQGNWMMQNEKGEMFGLGPNGDAPFWVHIQVIQEVTITPTVTLTLTPTHIVYLEGTVSMLDGDLLDLDTGAVHPETQLADLTYNYLSGNHVLTSANGAGMMLFEVGTPEFSDCRSALVGSLPISFSGIQMDTYMCYRTNQGLPGRLRLFSFDDESEILKLEFMTWSLP